MAVRSYVVRIFVTKFQEKFVVQTKPQVSLQQWKLLMDQHETQSQNIDMLLIKMSYSLPQCSYRSDGSILRMQPVTFYYRNALTTTSFSFHNPSSKSSTYSTWRENSIIYISCLLHTQYLPSWLVDRHFNFSDAVIENAKSVDRDNSLTANSTSS